jgi:hypothetical protein
MEIVITENGFLVIKRGKEAVPQKCPHQEKFCGHSCPLFGEPRVKGNLGKGAMFNISLDQQSQVKVKGNLGKGAMTLCGQTVLRFDKITDKRDG